MRAGLIGGVLALGLAIGGTVVLAEGARAEERAPASGTEWWYVLRGRANMKIGNYRAAIESYEKAAEKNPDNREALKQLGVAYEKQGLTTKAIEAYDRYLARFDDDPDVAFQQADVLGWERYAYRRADAIRYYRMGLARREDLARRHSLARLLAQDKRDLAPALAEYRALLAARPGDATWRAEYRELLLWDPEHLDEAIREFRRAEAERPGDFEVKLRLAELIARRDPKSDEAASRYAALVARRPDDARLRLVHAEILGADPRKREQAIAAYREAVARDPRPEVRETYADLLSAGDAHRAEAVMQYRVLLRERPADVGVRLKLARLLAAKRQDAQAAAVEYQAVLARDPQNAEAHAGLAQVYAWLGDRDLALHHSNLSLRYGAQARASAGLRSDLMRGRETYVGPLVRGFFQDGGTKTELYGVVAGAKGKADVTPFVSVALEAGFEDWFRSHDDARPDDDQAAGYFELDGEYRLDPEQRIELGLGYHSLTQSGRDVLGRAAFARSRGTVAWKAGFARTLRFDSFTALVGEEVSGQTIGAARDNRFFARVERDGPRLFAAIEPYTGWVGARGIDANPFVGARGELRWRFAPSGVLEVASFYRAELYHFQDEAFGIDPLQDAPAPGGYFSPQLYVEQVPGLRLDANFGGRHAFTFEGGPAALFVKEGGDGVDFNLGGHARIAYVLRLRESLAWNVEAGFTRIGDVFTRAQATTGLQFHF